ncbi:efflux transporter outer membrane subunit [Chromobacterium haemolyticum]|uniref:efflux transporter outer membrane subunit n=1 Tax=Chromobacterium haemolyticum TaxID=394935 RepID=UPI0017463180|nr:efflux transporter outer membrane subunit [Chromobacterium haemolyticum]QOD81965.1 efflux transporter outer membrane subunit [Chromobacterium haemolyticum]
MNPSRLAVSLSLVLLAGCAVGPDYQPPTPAQLLPAATAETEPEAAGWWQAFQDPALNRLVGAALRHSPDLASADANIRQARSALEMNAGAQWPQLNAAGRVSRDQLSRRGEALANIPFANPQTLFTDYRAGFDASWEIDLFGHTARSVEAGRARLEASREQAADAALRVTAETARLTLDYRYWSLRADNAAAQAGWRAELARLTRLQFQAGLAGAGEVDQAEAERLRADAQLQPLLAARQAALAALGPLTALPTAALRAQMDGVAPEPRLPPTPAAGLPSELLLRRPDLRAAERQLAAASADIGVATAEQYPRFSLLASGGWDSVRPGDFASQASRYWSLGPQLNLPLFAGGRLQAQVRAREAGYDAALAQYRKAVLQALADVETAFLRSQAGRVQEARLSDGETTLQRQLGYARQRVAVGEAAQSHALEAQLQLAALREQRLAARQTLSADLIALYKALGGAPTRQPPGESSR